MTLLTFEAVSCVRGDRLLFERLNLKMRPGAAAVVIGPNGVGKSSLLRIAAGLLRPAGGRVERHGAAALADEHAALDERLTLAKALGFWAGLDGGSAEAGMAGMGIAHLAKVPVRMLSTGQRKRAALARVIGSGAKLWLLDEPANGLDGEGVERLTQAMAAHRHGGGAVLAATHQSLGLADAAMVALA